MGSALRRGVIAAAVAGALGAGGAAAWRGTAEWRARLATRRTLDELAVSMRFAADAPEPGPLPVDDAWGHPIRHLDSPLGQWLESDGADGQAGTADDEIWLVSLSALGRSIDTAALAIREGHRPDLDGLAYAGTLALGQPVTVRIRDDILFEDASGEIVFAVELTPLGMPVMP